MHLKFKATPPRAEEDENRILVHSVDTTNKKLRKAAGKRDWFHLSIGYVVVPTKGPVKWEIFGGNPHWCSGLNLDYVWLRPTEASEADIAASFFKVEIRYQRPGLTGFTCPSRSESYLVHVLEHVDSDSHESVSSAESDGDSAAGSDDDSAAGSDDNSAAGSDDDSAAGSDDDSESDDKSRNADEVLEIERRSSKKTPPRDDPTSAVPALFIRKAGIYAGNIAKRYEWMDQYIAN